jgi:ribose/xylose/arabinose/galactoside ABC-type transport system permease subunit
VTRLQDQRADRDAGDAVGLSRRPPAGLRGGRHQHRNNFTVFGQTQILGIYSPFWFMVVILLIFAFLVGRTRYFRQAYYIGGNARAAKLSGINVDRTVFSFFLIMGFLSGLAGALLIIILFVYRRREKKRRAVVVARMRPKAA